MKRFRLWTRRILPLLAITLLAGLILSRVYRPDPPPRHPNDRIEAELRITAFEAADYIGRAAEVCGTVHSAEYLPGIGGSPTFLNFERPYPDQPFTAVVWGEDRHRFRVPPEEYVSGRNLCVTGRIRDHDGVPQIRVRSPGQLR